MWSAKDQVLKKVVAIKAFSQNSSGKGKEEILKGIRLVGKIERPGVPPVYDVGINKN